MPATVAVKQMPAETERHRSGAVVKETRTGLTHTRVLADGDRYRWQRLPGTLAGHGPRLSPPALLRGLPGKGRVEGVDFVPGTALDGGPVEYHVSGYRTLAGLFLENPEQVRAPSSAVLDLLERLGAGLHALHETEAGHEGTADHGDTSRAPSARLVTWLSSPPAPGTATAVLTDAALRLLGKERLLRLRSWCDLPGTEPGVLTHGAPSLGGIVLSRTGTGIEILSGESLVPGAPESDLGRVLGELRELTFSTEFSGPGPGHRPLEEALLRGYGGFPDPALLHRAATVRIALHIHDFAAFVGAHPHFDLYLTQLARLLDTEPRSADETE